MKPLLSFLMLSVFCAAAWSAEPVTVLKKNHQPAEMMNNWLNSQAAAAFQKWEEKYEQLKTPEQIAAYQQQLREQFVEQLGGFPERTPLNARITGTVQRPGYRVEKVLFESQPQHYVSALCFIPDSKQHQGPYPGVLVVCGHSANGKALPGYQTACALLALNGIVGLIIDPISQGERSQHINEQGKNFVPGSTEAHTLIGLGSILLGQNTARFEVWDGMRGIDYLQSREDVDSEKIGCMGNSGGGTQAAYLMALDDRIQAASPACYITSFSELLATIGPQDAEQNIHGQLQWGMDHADYLLMRAPMPINICSATQDFFSIKGAWDSYRKAKRIYSRLGYPERVSLTEVDEQHGWHRPLRESGTQWMVRWLGGRDIVVREPEVQLLSDAEVQVTEKGQVQLIPGARSVYDLNLEEYDRLAKARQTLWQNPENALKKVQERAGISDWEQIALPEAEKTGELTREGVRIEKWILQPEPGILLPALLYQPVTATATPRVVVCVNEAGKSAEFEHNGQTISPETLAREGAIVLAVDLRGSGETTPANGRWYNRRFGEDGRQVTIAYLLGRSYVGMRANDLLAATKWLQQGRGIPAGSQLELISVGEVGVPALHAAALTADLWSQVQLHQSLLDWKQIVASPLSEDQTVHCLHGALQDYELTNLTASLKDKIQVFSPVNALKQPVNSVDTLQRPVNP